MSVKGIVKWFNKKKGFGFIEHQNGDDVFVKLSALERNGVRTLHEGEKVRFEIVESDRGASAANVVVQG
ncbi:MAG: cold-shock protein [Thermodesulfobacteriota bacterium]|nr:cold-shock protein [Thermodesulfobacteriota bacterium]